MTNTQSAMDKKRKKSKRNTNPCVSDIHKAATLPPKSSTVTVSGDEDLQRIFYTRRDPRRVRTLKSLRFLKRTPSSVTFAETGVQVCLPTKPTPPEEVVEALKDQLQVVTGISGKNCEEAKSSHEVVTDLETVLDDFISRVDLIEKDLVKAEQSNSNFQEQLTGKDQELKQLKSNFKNSNQQLGEYKLQLAQTQAEVESLAKEKSRLLTTVGDLQLETERLELDIAFLTEEKGDLETSLGEHKSLLDMVTYEKDEFQSKEEDLKTALLQTKVNSAEQVGKYLDELNAVWTEKRNFIQNKLAGQPMSKELKKVLTNAERLLELEEERNRLVDKVELLSSQTVFQDLLVEQFQKRMLRLKRILEGTDPGALRDQLLTDELVKARKLLRRESSIFNVMEKAHKGSPKGSKKQRPSSSLPSSPLATTKFWAMGDAHAKRSPEVTSKQPVMAKDGGEKVTEGKGKTRRKLDVDPNDYRRRSLPTSSPKKVQTIIEK